MFLYNMWTSRGTQQHVFTFTWSQPDSATNLLQRKVFVLLLKGGSGLCRSLLPPLSTHSKANSILYRLQVQAGAKSYIQFQRTSFAVIESVSTLHWWMSCDVFVYFWGGSTKSPARAASFFLGPKHFRNESPPCKRQTCAFYFPWQVRG